MKRTRKTKYKSENQYLVPDLERIYNKYVTRRGDVEFTCYMDMLNGHVPFGSAIHSIVLSYFNTERALKELQSVYYYQRFDGAVPLMMKTGKRVTAGARFFNFIFSGMFDDSGISHLIGPPLGLYAIARLSSQDSLSDSLKDLLPFAQREMYFLEQTRELWGEGLPVIIHPFESGYFQSQLYDEVLEIDVKGKISFYRQMLRIRKLLQVNEKAEWGNIPSISDMPFRFIDPYFCAVYLAGLHALKKSCLEIDQSMKDYLKHKINTITSSVEERLWSDEYECYLPQYFQDGWKPVRSISISSILMLFSGVIDKKRAEQMVSRYLMPGYGFWQKMPLSGSLIERKHDRQLSHYRGGSVNIVCNWMIYHGLITYGYTDLAEQLRRATMELVETSGLYSWYDIESGRGLGSLQGTLSGIVLDF
ncbi:MAG: MGH1-like glycoside hydrolase domain-containing protein [Spirochaetota bacterium]